MGGRHRDRAADPRARWLLATAVSVLAASGMTAATLLGVGPLSAPQAATSASLLAPPVGPGAAPEAGAPAGRDPIGGDPAGADPAGGDPTVGAPAGSDPTPANSPAATAGPGRVRTSAALFGDLPDGAAAVLATSGARTAARAAASSPADAVRSTPGARTAATGTRTGGVCDLDGPPRFDDPAHPDAITNRDCGYTDARGRARSHDPWIDGQLRASYGE